MTPRHVLLISPAFHGYWQSIAAGLEAHGCRVTTHRYDDFASFRDKARNKVCYELADRRGGTTGATRFARDATRDARAVLRATRPDAVLAVKCDIFERTLWDDIDAAGIPTTLWLYDELRRTLFASDDLSHFGAVASYSREDTAALNAQGIAAHHLPLAFDPTVTTAPIPSDDVVFVGARYPAREELLCAMHRAGVPVRAYGRDWSHHPADRARTWSWSRPDVPAGRQLSRATSCGVLAGGTAALNVHGDQDGFTMRTFEAAGVGALQLIDRLDLEGLYDPGVEVVPFSGADEAIEAARRAARDRAWRTKVGDAGRARTRAEHTFVHRMRELVQWWG